MMRMGIGFIIFSFRNGTFEDGVTSEERLAQLCAAAPEDEILFLGPETVAAFIVEPVLGRSDAIAR